MRWGPHGSGRHCRPQTKGIFADPLHRPVQVIRGISPPLLIHFFALEVVRWSQFNRWADRDKLRVVCAFCQVRAHKIVDDAHTVEIMTKRISLQLMGLAVFHSCKARARFANGVSLEEPPLPVEDHGTDSAPCEPRAGMGVDLPSIRASAPPSALPASPFSHMGPVPAASPWRAPSTPSWAIQAPCAWLVQIGG